MRAETVLLVSGLSKLLLGQAAEPKPAFEVASVRPSAPGERNELRGGPGTSDSEQIRWTATSLDFLVRKAYGIEPDQLIAPEWLNSARFDVSAKISQGATPEQFNKMLQRLLAERFHLEAHLEKRIFPGYFLVQQKAAPKLKPSEWVPPPRPSPVPGRIYIGSARVYSVSRGGNWVVTGRGAAISDLVRSLRASLRRRVIDQTGLTGSYDFTFEYSTGPNASDAAGSYILDALHDQLGLDLKETKLSVDVLVVDRTDRTPVEN